MSDRVGERWTILVGDVLDRLREIADGSVACAVTSPPYWGLRDYGHAGQIGLERTPQEYVDRLVGVFREVRRVLRPEGVLWLNLGDCYATGGGKVGECPGGGEQGARWRGEVGRARDDRRRRTARPEANGRGEEQDAGEAVGPTTQPNRMPIPGLKPKDLVGIPWRVAFALQADGWYLRSDVVWSKPNPMPESIRDRPTKAHEYVFLLSKSERYAWDAAAIAEPAIFAGKHVKTNGADGYVSDRVDLRTRDGFRRGVTVGKTRNRRSVWTIPSEPFPGAHFAVMPLTLARDLVASGGPGDGFVLDPFAGAGTTGVAAIEAGARFVGVEIRQEYADLAAARLGQITPPMFHAPPAPVVEDDEPDPQADLFEEAAE